jgi:hypothetical protein
MQPPQGPGYPYPPGPPGQGNHPYQPYPQQPSPPQPSPAGVIDTLVPTNPLAAVACWAGIFSVLVCGLGVILGPIAVVTGILSLKRGAIIQQSGYGKATSTARSWIGIVAGGLGSVASIVFIIVMLLGKR